MPEAGLHTSPVEIIDAALARGLEAIAVTNHNTVDGIEEMAQIGKQNGLVVFPGIEISSRVGHALAIFDVGTSPESLSPLIKALGFTTAQAGRGFDETDYALTYVFEEIERFGGLAIAAHIDRKPKGFFASDLVDPAEKLRTLLSPHLSALEITVQSNRMPWNLGQVPGYTRKIACIQGSDSHSPSEVARRFTLVDAPELSLEGLRLAFEDFQNRVRFPDEA